MKYKLKVYSIWEFGQRKDSQGNPHQEDNMFPAYGKQSDDDRLFILCDGMGGHDAGEVASATVCDAMSQSIINDGHDEDGVFTVADFNTAIEKAFMALDERDSGAEKKMGTTMTFLKLHNEGALIAHMGDSRVYHIRPGKDGSETQILFETSDHSLVNDLIKIGELTKEEARHSKQKNVITRAMQPKMSRKPKADIYQTIDIKAGDYFYLCSDGMLEQADMEDGSSLKNVFSKLGGSDEHKVEILKSVTEKNRDNHTAFIIHITEVIDPVEKTLLTDIPSEDKVDKFTAIVEDEGTTPEVPDESGSVNSSRTAELPANPTKASSLVESNDNGSVHHDLANGILTEGTASSETSISMELNNKKGTVPPKMQRLNTKKVRSSVVRFAVAAIVVMAIILGISCVKSCLSDKDNPSAEMFDGKPQKTKQDNHHTQKPSRGKKTETATNANENAAIQAANSSATENLTSGIDNSQQSVPTQSSANLPPHFSNSDDVVSSDAQIIQDNINK